VNPLTNEVSIALKERAQGTPILAESSVDRHASYTRRKAAIWINRQTSGTYPAGAPFSHTAYADIDHDGDADYLRAIDVAGAATPVQVMINNGNGTFSDQTAARIIGPQPGVVIARKVLAGDYNADGWVDFFVLSHGPDEPPFPGEFNQMFLSNGNGTMHYDPQFEADVAFFHGGASADFNGDGRDDVRVGGAFPHLWLNDGDGTWTANRSRLPIRTNGAPVVFDIIEAIDIDGDGFLDLICQEPTVAARLHSIYWGAADGLYRDWRKTTLPPMPDAYIDSLDYAAEDIDRDGRRDIIVNWADFQDKRYLQVLRQASPRVFVDETATRMAMNTALRTMDYIRAQDVNGDGHVDVFIDDKQDVETGEYAWTNNGNGVFAPYSGSVLPAEPVRLSIADASVQEGNAGSTNLVFTVLLSRAATLPVVFDIATANGTATAGSDFSALSASAQSIAAGQLSRTFSVAIVGDTTAEPSEAFLVRLSHVIGASVADDLAVGTIANDDTLTLRIDDANITEGDSGTKALAFNVSLNGTSGAPVGFSANSQGNTATPGSDFISLPVTAFSIPAGQVSKVVNVTINGDTAVEGNEAFFVWLSSVSGATLQDGQGFGTITNDDVVKLGIADASTTEGNSGTKQLTFTVSLSQAAPTTVTFNANSQSNTATVGSDFVSLPVTAFSIPAGQLTKTFTVTINGDTTVENDETFFVWLSSVSGATLQDGQGIGTLTNDD
jgi:hypothetical protein